MHDDRGSIEIVCERERNFLLCICKIMSHTFSVSSKSLYFLLNALNCISVKCLNIERYDDTDLISD
jgi:hypothetical protein